MTFIAVFVFFRSSVDVDSGEGRGIAAAPLLERFELVQGVLEQAAEVPHPRAKPTTLDSNCPHD